MRRAVAPTVMLLAACKFTAPGAADDGPVIDAPGSGQMDAPAPTPDTPPGPGRKKRITIDGTKVMGDQAAFPVWITLTGDADLMARATMAGTDIHFTKPDGTALEHQIQTWAKPMGKLEAWVRVDLVNATSMELDLRYGDPAVTHAPNGALVFGSSFEAVWHLDDPLMNNTIVDSTTKRNGTASNLAAADQIAAQLGGGIKFSGNESNADQIQFTNPYANGGPHTISAWVDQKARGGSCDSIVTMGNASNNDSRWFHSYYNANNQAAIGFYGGINYDWNNPPNMGIENAGWTLVHWVFQGDTSSLTRMARWWAATRTRRPPPRPAPPATWATPPLAGAPAP